MDEVGVTGVVLAGGEGKRFGGAKAFARIGEHTFVERTIGTLKEAFDHIIVVAGSMDKFTGLSCNVATDIIPGMGALGGLYTGLMLSTTDFVFAVACDMPLLSVGGIRAMLKELDDYLGSGEDGSHKFNAPFAIVPEHDGMLEPLHAVYSKACTKPIENLIKDGNRKILDLFPKIKTIKTTLDGRDAKDMFFNVNTKEDLARAEAIVSAGRD